MEKIGIKVFKSNLIASNMYFLIYDHNVIIIDPCISNEALKYIKENSLRVDYIFLTHEHYDHISGVNWLKELFNCKVICCKECAEAIQDPKLNFSKYFDVLMELSPNDEEMNNPINVEPYSCFADIILENQKTIEWKGSKINFISTPGHSKGSTCILVNNKYLFSGDSLLRDYPAVTRLKGGSSKLYKELTLKYLKSLSSDILVFPGHFDSFLLKDKLNLIENNVYY